MDDDNDSHDPDAVADDWEGLSDAVKAEASGAAGSGGATAAEGGLGLDGIALEDSKGEAGEGEVGAGAGDGQEAEEEEEKESVEVVSERLMAAFLNGLKKNLKDAQLPMLVSTFYSSVLLPSRPPGTSIDVKKTRFRKISNFLREMEERGLVTLQVGPGRRCQRLPCFEAKSTRESWWKGRGISAVLTAEGCGIQSLPCKDTVE